MDAPDVHHAAHGLREALTHKIGPFPGYVWALGAGGLLALYLHSHGSGGGGSAVDPRTLVPNGSLGGSAGGGAGDLGGAGFPPVIGDPNQNTIGEQPSEDFTFAPVATTDSRTSEPAFAPVAISTPTGGYDLFTGAVLSGNETPTDLQSGVSAPDVNGIYPASSETPVAIAGTAAPPGGYSANSTQGVFGVDLGNMDYPVPPAPSGGFPVNSLTDASSSGPGYGVMDLGGDGGGYGVPVVGGVLDPNVDYPAPAFKGSDVVPTNPDTGYAYGDVGYL